tara:strand:+ start:1980 stop:3008 length:1029 start_codon:yes stop_codon:yes gene_type:complete
MIDLERVKVIGREPMETQEEAPVQESVVETPEATEEIIAETPVEKPVETPVETQKVETTPVVNEFPSDKFGGKYKSWEEVNEVLNKPVVEAPKYDPFLQKVIDKFQADGNLTDFFKAHAVDYDKMSDEDAVKRDFFTKTPGLSEKAQKRAWEKELAKYNLDDLDAYDEEDIEIGRMNLKRDADKVRAEGKEEQSNYLQPTRQEQPKVDLTKLSETINAMPEVQRLKTEKKVSFNVDGNEITYEISDPDFAISTMADEKPFHDLFMENGRPKAEKWATVMEFARNPEKILKTVLDQGIAMGQKLIEKELKNPSIPNQQPEKFSSSSVKERFFETLAQKATQTN